MVGCCMSDIDEVTRQRDHKETVIKCLKQWRKDVCIQLAIKVRSSSEEALRKILELQNR